MMWWTIAAAAPVEVEPTAPALLDRCVAAADAQLDLPLEAPPSGPSDRVAVVFGVPCHTDPGVPSLTYSSRDALRMGQALAAGGFTVLSRTTLVDRATLDEALDQAEQRLSPGGTLVVYFSGHGVLRESEGRLTRWLVLSDTRLDDLTRTALPVAQLEARLSASGAVSRILIQDTCFAAGGKGLGLPEHTKGLAPLEQVELRPGDVRLWASRFFEQAIEAPERRASVYTDHLLASLSSPDADLDGDGCVGLLEAHHRAERATVEERAGFQVPVAWTRNAPDLLLGCVPGPPTRALVSPAPEGVSVDLSPVGSGEVPSPTLAVPPGTYRLRLSERGRLLADDTVRLGAGDRLDPADRLRRRQRLSGALQLGGGPSLTDELPPWQGVASASVVAPGRNLRPVIGLSGSFAPDNPTVPIAAWSFGGRSGLWWTPASPNELAVGPWLEVGLIRRTLLEVPRSDPGLVLATGLHGQAGLGLGFLFVEPQVTWLPLDRQQTVLHVAPGARVGLGVRL